MKSLTVAAFRVRVSKCPVTLANTRTRTPRGSRAGDIERGNGIRGNEHFRDIHRHITTVSPALVACPPPVCVNTRSAVSSPYGLGHCQVPHVSVGPVTALGAHVFWPILDEDGGAGRKVVTVGANLLLRTSVVGLVPRGVYKIQGSTSSCDPPITQRTVCIKPSGSCSTEGV